MTTFARPDHLIELTERGIRAAHPETSFPATLQLSHIVELGYLPVQAAPEPDLQPGQTLQQGPLLYEGEQVVRSWLIIEAAPPTAIDVDAERDRRISAGFLFQGVHYQSRLPSANQAGDWEVFSGKALEALIATMAGAQPSDLRWSDPESDFAWIAADNSRVPMDAPAVIELARAASAHRTRHTFAGSDLKAMQPIPHDYTNDEWWPA